jgi:hypothetical protein
MRRLAIAAIVGLAIWRIAIPLLATKFAGFGIELPVPARYAARYAPATFLLVLGAVAVGVAALGEALWRVAKRFSNRGERGG